MRGAFKKKTYKRSLTVRVKTESVSGWGEERVREIECMCEREGEWEVE